MSEIICVTNRSLCKTDFLSRLEEISHLDNVKIILREKELDEKSYTALAYKVIELCGKDRIILNRFTVSALTLNHKALQLPMKEFLSLGEGERRFFNFLGASCHSAEEGTEAEKNGCDFLIAGHIFETDCKKGLAPRGTEFLKRVRENYSGKLYAIGGISPENAVLCKTAGAQGVCVMSGFMTCENVFGFYEKFKKAGYFNENR